jgi:hypothetical protein
MQVIFQTVLFFEEAEMIALKKYSKGKYPKLFPWMK